MSYIRCGLLALQMLHSGACLAASCADGVRPDGQTVELSGILHQQVQWGPPNFGENPQTDKKFTAWIITMTPPLPVQSGANIDASPLAVSKLQLSIDPTSFRIDTLPALDGKMVIATGKLWNATSQGDVTPVVLSVKVVLPTDHSVCRIVVPN